MWNLESNDLDTHYDHDFAQESGGFEDGKAGNSKGKVR